MTDPHHALSAGDLIAGNYRVLGVAGSGGMGVVYRALDVRLERTVALKFLPAELHATEHDRERFLREARAASSLDHPNIGVIYGVESSESSPVCIVMAFYDGDSLAERIRAGPLPPPEAVEIALQMAEGLAAAHERAIVHRDIKPSNVMLTSSGMVKIVDFGLAQMASTATASQTGTVGTVAYMSPEQAMGRATDARVDLWALGVVLAEMLAGDHPFRSDNPTGMLFAILNEPPRRLEGAPASLLPILYRCLSKDPEKRYPASGELVADLRAARLQLRARDASGPAAATARENPGTRRAREEASRSAWLPAAPARRRLRPWQIEVAAAALVLALGVSVALWQAPGLRDRLLPSLGATRQKHIAVLPFESAGSNPENVALAAGLMDSLTGRLSNLRAGEQSLWVVPDSEVRRLKITDPEQALRQLHANLAVKGTFAHDGEKVQLHLNLIDTEDLRQVGSVEVQGRSGDLAALENESVAQLSRLLDLSPGPGGQRDTATAAKPAAYENYLTALGYMQRYDKAGNLDRAIAALQQAIATDPRFAVGYAELGEAYRLKYRTTQNPAGLTDAEANCRKALELNDRLAGPYVTLGRLHDMSGKHDLALGEFQHALELDPTDPTALAGIGHVYDANGRTQDAEAAYRKAVDLRPEDWDSYNNLGIFLQKQRRYPDAIAAYRQALEKTPDNAQVLLNLGGAYIEAGDPRSLGCAESSLQRAIRISPSYGAYSNLGMLYLRRRRYREAADATRTALAINPSDYLVWDNLRSAEEWLQDKPAGTDAAAREAPLLRSYLRTNPLDAGAHATLAEVLSKSASRDEALGQARTAVALAGADPAVLESAAVTYHNLGDANMAAKLMREAFAHGMTPEQAADDPEAQQILSYPQLSQLTTK